MSGRRDTGFPAQFMNQSNQFAPSRKNTGGSKAGKTAVHFEQKSDDVSQQEMQKTSPSKTRGRRATGFPTPNLSSAAHVSQQELQKTSPSKTRGRRDTGFPTPNLSSAAPVLGFGQQRRGKVHGAKTSAVQDQLSSAKAREAAMAKIHEHEASCHEKEVLEMRKQQYIQEKVLKRRSEEAKPKKRTSMFSASRRIVERASMYILPKLGLHKEPGRVSAEEDDLLKVYPMNEVAIHNTASSTWIVIHGRVYDVTSWMWSHPGREVVFQTNAGKDVTAQFEANFHSNYARDKAKQYMIGKVEGRKLSDLHQNVNSKVNNNGNWSTSGNMNIATVIVAVLLIRLLIVFFKE